MEKPERAIRTSWNLFPAWLSWLMLLVVIWLFIQVWVLQARVGVVASRTRFRNEQELEAAYTKGLVDRDNYERLKGRLS
ncbi:MAG TPA: hypothetical protein VD969_16115 [Symbiobacteriaceae bacterium]|nr:hypothetical protein [Symbiobacteriaceae bacterium]